MILPDFCSCQDKIKKCKDTIERYKIIEEEKHKVLTDKIEIVRVDLPYYVEKCYNEDASKLDYKDKFIGLIGIEDRVLAKSITKGEKDMEDILDKLAEKYNSYSNFKNIIQISINFNFTKI